MALRAETNCMLSGNQSWSSDIAGGNGGLGSYGTRYGYRSDLLSNVDGREAYEPKRISMRGFIHHA